MHELSLSLEIRSHFANDNYSGRSATHHKRVQTDRGRSVLELELGLVLKFLLTVSCYIQRRAHEVQSSFIHGSFKPKTSLVLVIVRPYV